MRDTHRLKADGDVVLTKGIYKSKDVVQTSDDGGSVAPAEAPFVRRGHFRLMDLPAELRVYIYQFLLPSNMVIKFKPKSMPLLHARYSKTRDQADTEHVPEWSVVVTPKHAKDASTAPAVTAPQIHSVILDRRRRIIGLRKLPYTPRPPNEIQTQLFLVSKAISQEARAVLYGSNTYAFTIDSHGHTPISLKSPRIFGPFGEDTKLSLLRNLRSIHLDILLNDSTHWGEKRQRARLEYFVSILKAHADDEHMKSLLQELAVTMSPLTRSVMAPSNMPHPRTLSRSNQELFMFGLESLTALRGIKHVAIKGVPEWYAECLEVCIKGKGGEILETEWPIAEVRRKKKSMWQNGKGKIAWATSRKWYQPKLDWKEFAERNGVGLPEDVDKYWMYEV